MLLAYRIFQYFMTRLHISLSLSLAAFSSAPLSLLLTKKRGADIYRRRWKIKHVTSSRRAFELGGTFTYKIISWTLLPLLYHAQIKCDGMAVPAPKAYPQPWAQTWGEASPKRDDDPICAVVLLSIKKQRNMRSAKRRYLDEIRKSLSSSRRHSEDSAIKLSAELKKSYTSQFHEVNFWLEKRKNLICSKLKKGFL
jgi:hypothetical protein